MFKTLSGCLTVLIISLCFFSIANAATLVLQSGSKIEGQIMEQTDTYVTVDVHGMPTTYYLAEIVSIDGKAVSMPEDKESAVALKKIADQKVPLPPATTPSVSIAAPTASAVPRALGGTNRSVVTTPDGGIIVVDNDKITKYDKDLQIIKVIDLTAATAPAPPAVVPAAIPVAVAKPPVTTPPTPAAAPASLPQDRSTVSQDPPTLKDFLHREVSLMSSDLKKY